LNYEKTETFNYSSHNPHTNFSNLNNINYSSKINNILSNEYIKRENPNEHFNTISDCLKNNKFNNSNYGFETLRNQKSSRNDFETIGQIAQEQQNTVDIYMNNNILDDKNNYYPSYGGVNSGYDNNSCNSKEENCDGAGVDKKEDLRDKINEIKIYLKNQFAKGSEKKDSDTTDCYIINSHKFKCEASKYSIQIKFIIL